MLKFISDNDHFSKVIDLAPKAKQTVTYDPTEKKPHTFSVANVGEILSVTGDTFTSRNRA